MAGYVLHLLCKILPLRNPRVNESYGINLRLTVEIPLENSKGKFYSSDPYLWFSHISPNIGLEEHSEIQVSLNIITVKVTSSGNTA
jgi:hypothetical protein